MCVLDKLGEKKNSIPPSSPSLGINQELAGGFPNTSQWSTNCWRWVEPDPPKKRTNATAFDEAIVYHPEVLREWRPAKLIDELSYAAIKDTLHLGDSRDASAEPRALARTARMVVVHSCGLVFVWFLCHLLFACVLR